MKTSDEDLGTFDFTSTQPLAVEEPDPILAPKPPRRTFAEMLAARLLELEMNKRQQLRQQIFFEGHPISTSTVGAWLSGKGAPRPAVLDQLLVVLQIPEEDHTLWEAAAYRAVTHEKKIVKVDPTQVVS